MTQDQVAINARATRSLAERLEARHYPGDPQAEAEAIVRQLLADGLAPIRRPETIPARGRGGSDQARAEALRATAEAVAAAKARHPADTTPEAMAGPRDLTRLAILLSEDNVTDRQERLDWCGAMVGRTLTSSTELTRTEARWLIATLEVPAPELPLADETPAADPVVDTAADEVAPPDPDNGLPDMGPPDDEPVRRGFIADPDDEPVARPYGAVVDVDA